MTLRRKAILCAVLLVAITMLSPLLSTVNAYTSIPIWDKWQGLGAMAHWEVKNSNGTTVAVIEAILAKQLLDDSGEPDYFKTNMLYLYVIHPTIDGGTDSTSIVYNIPFTWSTTNVYVSVLNMRFPWVDYTTAPHNITITWNANSATESTIGYYIGFFGKTGINITSPGVWYSSTAQITIDAQTGRHPTTYASTWGVIGNKMRTVGTYKDWTVMLDENRIYICPPPGTSSLVRIMSVGTSDSNFYERINWTPINAAASLIDECMRLIRVE